MYLRQIFMFLLENINLSLLVLLRLLILLLSLQLPFDPFGPIWTHEPLGESQNGSPSDDFFQSMAAIFIYQ